MDTPNEFRNIARCNPGGVPADSAQRARSLPGDGRRPSTGECYVAVSGPCAVKSTAEAFDTGPVAPGPLTRTDVVSKRRFIMSSTERTLMIELKTHMSIRSQTVFERSAHNLKAVLMTSRPTVLCKHGTRYVLCEPAVCRKGLRHLVRHFHLSEDLVRLSHSGKEEFGDFTRASLGVSLLPLFQTRRPDYLFRVRQRKPILALSHLLGKGGGRDEIVCTFVSCNSGMLSNVKNNSMKANSPALHKDFGDVAPSFVSQRVIELRAGKHLQGSFPFCHSTVQGLGVQVATTLVTDLEHVHRVRQVAEIYEFLELPVDKNVSRIFTVLHLTQPGRFSHSCVERKQPQEDQP
ncbi:hypothetical protein EVAR_27957_1 [Eumeta japonica]|uniref:Uncharacterized protein n=1 Tax=Eumeta variegata TaxID=151549 RepID=A0A4C1ZY26_EUMVA|nr:hypothetical protein EVAR_27957_1 [Eumeta japonica]